MSENNDRLKPFQIAQTVDGQPVWMDPKDLILTPDENLEFLENKKSGRDASLIEQMAKMVIENSTRFVEQTFTNMMPQKIVDGFLDCKSAKTVEWIDREGLEVEQDGLKTVVKRKGKVIREMTATIEPKYREDVAKCVMRLLKSS